MRTPVVGLPFVRAVAMTVVGGGGATPRQAGAAPLRVERSVHASRASTDVRTDVAPMLDRGVTAVVGGGGGALVINPTFDSSITNDPNAAAIEAMIDDAISTIASLFDDPIVVQILFRYSTTYADGTTSLPPQDAAVSESGLHVVPWNTFLSALTADATTANDATANATLPGGALTTNIDPSSANGRAVGLNTPPVMFADGSVGAGGLYDGIITLNSLAAFQFTRPLTGGTLDARRFTEHEIDEVLGLGSNIDRHPDLRPQDLFAWSAPGLRNLTSSGSRYFSIDGGTTDIVDFNQEAGGDLGDWLSGPCPQVPPLVQNAFSCPDQVADVTPTSPEGINLDVIGYDPVGTPGTTTTTLPCQSPAVGCCPVGQPGCGLCGTDCGNGSCCLDPFPVCDNANAQCLAPCPGSQALCTDAALGFPDVACCAPATKKKQCASSCRPIVTACKARCAAASHAKKCKKQCRGAIVGHCKQSPSHACS
jgi:hypothetical protein